MKLFLMTFFLLIAAVPARAGLDVPRAGADVVAPEYNSGFGDPFAHAAAIALDDSGADAAMAAAAAGMAEIAPAAGGPDIAEDTVIDEPAVLLDAAPGGGDPVAIGP
jgi:hypothetical protein